jgi:voltage-gated sodium channel
MASQRRERILRILESSLFQKSMMGIIMLYALEQGIDVSIPVTSVYRWFFDLFDTVILCIFLLESGVKLYAKRLAMFRSGWDMFDLLVVVVALIPEMPGGAVLRSLRILRSFRLFSTSPRIRVFIDGIVRAGSTLLVSLMITATVFYIFAILCIKMFGIYDPKHFGNLLKALMSLYTLTMSSGLEHTAIDKLWIKFDWAWMVFIPYIALTSFAIINVFVSIFCAAIYEIADEERAKKRGHEQKNLNDQLDAIQKELTWIKSKINDIQ